MKPEAYPVEPAALWEHFYQFSRIPRPSGLEGAVREYICALADARNHQWCVDDRGNLVVYVPGTVGRESDPCLAIQNHLDMVTVSGEGVEHNFQRDPLQLQVEEGWLSATGTTLGADNGLGCAAALALMTDADVEHPPLELLFTVEEETGLYGASALDASLISAPRMLNLDTEDWGELFVGCAGGRGWEFSRTCQLAGPPGRGSVSCAVELSGLAGGHSGIQIHQQLGNALKLLAEWADAATALGIQIAEIEAGIAHNVIARQRC